MEVNVYNPQSEGIFPVTSCLVTGATDAILFDGQFSVKDGKKLLELIEYADKILLKIVITCGDPDFYFGLEPIAEAYPKVKIVACRQVVEYIHNTRDAKFEKWAPLLNDGAPSTLYVPKTSKRNLYTIENQSIELRHEDHYAAYFWIPAIRTILGGIAVYWGIHVFTADMRTPGIRESWCDVLREMIETQPYQVIPGHYLGDRPIGDLAVRFTLEYLITFEKVLMENEYKNANAVISAMKNVYPNLGQETWLETSAKVNTGEMEYGGEKE